ncbi:MAG: hypothetical protein GMKNLPBB_01704 [Myxococcota bacterium]|nr:hypothetical protein [Myxococcota bacterium]
MAGPREPHIVELQENLPFFVAMAGVVGIGFIYNLSGEYWVRFHPAMILAAKYTAIREALRVCLFCLLWGMHLTLIRHNDYRVVRQRALLILAGVTLVMAGQESLLFLFRWVNDPPGLDLLLEYVFAGLYYFGVIAVPFYEIVRPKRKRTMGVDWERRIVTIIGLVVIVLSSAALLPALQAGLASGVSQALKMKSWNPGWSFTRTLLFGHILFWGGYVWLRHQRNAARIGAFGLLAVVVCTLAFSLMFVHQPTEHWLQEEARLRALFVWIPYGGAMVQISIALYFCYRIFGRRAAPEKIISRSRRPENA